jgi:hypothetical protein
MVIKRALLNQGMIEADAVIIFDVNSKIIPQLCNAIKRIKPMWFVELSEQQQESLTGGNDFQTSDSNFNQSFAKKTVNKTKQGQNDISDVKTLFSDYDANSQSSFSTDSLKKPQVAPLNNFSLANFMPSDGAVAI